MTSHTHDNDTAATTAAAEDASVRYRVSNRTLLITFVVSALLSVILRDLPIADWIANPFGWIALFVLVWGAARFICAPVKRRKQERATQAETQAV